MGKIKIIVSPELEKALKGTLVIRIEEDRDEHTHTSSEFNVCNNVDILHFMDSIADKKESMGRIRTAETYRATRRSLSRFLGNRILQVRKFTTSTAEEYEGYLKEKGLSMNSISFYMRIMRAVYNEAVRNGLVLDSKPFAHVYTGVAKTPKRSIGMDAIRKLSEAKDLNEGQKLARDIFLFSFLTRGMSFVDIANLTKDNLCGDVLTYRRRKTGQTIRILWLKCMQNIVDCHPSLDGHHLLGLLDDRKGFVDKQYRRRQMSVNYMLRTLCKKAGIGNNVTMYAARHSWASIAKELDIPISVISDGMGHDSVQTTQIYLNSISSRIDAANEKVIMSVGLGASL